jgi:hypothetical protein
LGSGFMILITIVARNISFITPQPKPHIGNWRMANLSGIYF